MEAEISGWVAAGIAGGLAAVRELQHRKNGKGSNVTMCVFQQRDRDEVRDILISIKNALDAHHEDMRSFMNEIRK